MHQNASPGIYKFKKNNFPGRLPIPPLWRGPPPRCNQAPATLISPPVFFFFNLKPCGVIFSGMAQYKFRGTKTHAICSGT